MENLRVLAVCVAFVLLLGSMKRTYSLHTESNSTSNSACFGTSGPITMDLTCGAGHVIAIDTIWVGVKQTSVGCPSLYNDTTHTDVSCCTPSDPTTDDCIFAFDHSSNEDRHNICNGKQTCTIGAPNQVTIGQCDNTYPATTSYSYIEYHCIDETRISSVCSAVSTSTAGYLYIASNDFPNGMPTSTSDCTCAVQADDTNDSLTVTVIQRNLAQTSSCNQSLSLLDASGAVLVTWTCNDNTYVIESTSANDYVSVSLTNNNSAADGNFWLEVKASSLATNLQIICNGGGLSTDPSQSSKEYTVIIVVSVLGFVLLTVAACFIIFWFKVKRPKTDDDGSKPEQKDEPEQSSSKHETEPSSTKHETSPTSMKHKSESGSTQHETEPSLTKHDTPSPKKHEPGPAPIKHESEPSSTKHDTEPSSAKHEREPASTKHEREPASTKHETEPALNKHEAEPASMDLRITRSVDGTGALFVQPMYSTMVQDSDEETLFGNDGISRNIVHSIEHTGETTMGIPNASASNIALPTEITERSRNTNAISRPQTARTANVDNISIYETERSDSPRSIPEDIHFSDDGRSIPAIRRVKTPNRVSPFPY